MHTSEPAAALWLRKACGSARLPRARSPLVGNNVPSSHRPEGARELVYFFFLPVSSGGMSFLYLSAVTLPSMTAVLPSRKAMRERPSQFLKESTTSGCCGTKTTSAISLDLSECGLSIFLPPVSLPTLKLKAVARHAERPQRTKPIGE